MRLILAQWGKTLLIISALLVFTFAVLALAQNAFLFALVYVLVISGWLVRYFYQRYHRQRRMQETFANIQNEIAQGVFPGDGVVANALTPYDLAQRARVGFWEAAKFLDGQGLKRYVARQGEEWYTYEIRVVKKPNSGE